MDILGEKHDRQDLSNSLSKEANMEDILKALGDLDDNIVNVFCVTNRWDRLPIVSPESVDELSMAERIAVLEGKFKMFEGSSTSLRSDMITNNDTATQAINDLCNDSKTHGELIHQVINAKPTMAQVVLANRGVGLSSKPPSGQLQSQASSHNDGHHRARTLSEGEQADIASDQPFIIPRAHQRHVNRAKKSDQQGRNGAQPSNRQQRLPLHLVGTSSCQV